MELTERERWDEKQRLVERQRRRLKEENDVMAKVSAVATSRMLMNRAEARAMEHLRGGGYFLDPCQAMVEDSFMPWLHTKIKYRLQKFQLSRDLTKDLLRKAVEKASEKAANRKCWIRVLVRSIDTDDNTGGAGVVVGPIEVVPEDSVSSVAEKIRKWMESNGVFQGPVRLFYAGQELPANAPLLKSAPNLRELEVRSES
jgi:hypothetical protein